MPKRQTKIPRSSRIRVPFVNNPRIHNPTAEGICMAADIMGTTPRFAAALMSHILQEWTAQIIRGEVVYVPGWGHFGAMTTFKKRRRPRNGFDSRDGGIRRTGISDRVRVRIPAAMRLTSGIRP